METRIEILKNGVWRKLRLQDSSSIKYNAVINRIGKVDTREISHTNTFEIPSIYENRQVLGLNSFNKSELAKALNSKYEAKYYVNDKILQTGFLVINNSSDGNIKVNFIDESLSITDKWGTTTYKELLQDKVLPIPEDYKTAIQEMESYSMNKTAVLSKLSSVSTRGHNLALFPNNLNVIGDKFQLNTDEIRLDDSFNPYQSRPVFNTKAFLDIITESYGYTPIYDPSVDWDVVKKTYMISAGLSENAKDNGGITDLAHSIVSSNTPHWTSYDSILDSWSSQVSMIFPSSVGIKPVDVQGWPPPFVNNGVPLVNWPNDIRFKRCLFKPNVEDSNVGEIHFTAEHNSISGLTQVQAVWTNVNAGQEVVFKTLTPSEDNSTTEVVDLKIDKTTFDFPPTDGDELIGVMVLRGDFGSSPTSMFNMKVTETYLPPGLVSYDEQGQYLQDNVDLTHAASSKPIKKLLAGILHKEGILMSINNKDKEIKFFSYGAYEVQKNNQNYYNWSEYLLKYSPFIFNTEYGNNYATKNEIGLSTPYPGNTNAIEFSNQGEDSKYKDFTTNYVKDFKDISSVKRILNTNNPYTEFKNTGLGLVERVDDITGTFSQVRADSSVQGTFSDLIALANVNYADLPAGVEEWYRLVDSAVRVDAKFLIPIDVIHNLDLSKPVYIEELGGYYIIEEIAEYINNRTPVTVKLIKLIDNLRGLAPDIDTTPLPPFISLISGVNAPNGFTSFVYSIINNISFLNYTPTSATIKAVQLTDSRANGGIPTGFEFNSNVTIPPYTNTGVTFSGTLPLGTQEGWYEIQVTDNNGLQSSIQTVYFGDNTVVTPSVSLMQLIEQPLVNDSSSQFMASINFDPVNTTGTLEMQNVDVNFGNGQITNIGSPITRTVPNLSQGQNIFTISVTPTVNDYWYIKLTVDGIESNDRPNIAGSLPFTIV